MLTVPARIMIRAIAEAKIGRVMKKSKGTASPLELQRAA